MDFKNTLRVEINEKLNLIKNMEELSLSITKNIISMDMWKCCSKVFLYISFKNEVLTDYLIQEAEKSDKMIFAPLIVGKNMRFHRIDNLPKESLLKNRFGIYEPPKGLVEFFPDNQSLMIVPGLGFTKKGDRIGRGGGFYDRYLSNNVVNNKIAVAFEVQIQENIPTDEWDKKIKFVVTENKVYGEEYGN